MTPNDHGPTGPGGTKRGETAPIDGFIDALVEAGFDPEHVDAARRPGARRLAALLAELDAAPASQPAAHGDARATLIDVTFARVLRRRAFEATASAPALTPDDGLALDALVMAGFNAARVPGALRSRAAAHEALAGLVTSADPDAQGAPDRIARTLAAVEAHEAARRDRMRLAPAAERRFVPGVRLADLASVAAVLLIATAVVWPVMTAVREQGRRAVCEANFGRTALAMGSYANSHRDELPVVAASLSSGRWWDVNAAQPRSNSANLYELVRTRYAPITDLACPGNPLAARAEPTPDARDWRNLDEISYSYQIMFGRARPSWKNPAPAVVLTDRSPVVVRAVRGEIIFPNANSANHNGRGQHALLTDGSARWLSSPTLESGDNIWLPRQIERQLEEVSRMLGLQPLSGTEIPQDAADAFVGP